MISRVRDLMTVNLSSFILDNAIREANNFHYSEYADVLNELKNKLENLNRDKLSVEINESLVKKNDFVFLHIKGTDMASEDFGDAKMKKQFIEKIDKRHISACVHNNGKKQNG